MPNALKPRSIKIPDDTWSDWQIEAKAAGVSVTALIIARMAIAPPLFPAKPTIKRAGHPSGPVLSTVVPPNVSGQAIGYRPKASWKDPL